MSVVYPEKGQERHVAAELLELAGDRRSEIRTTTETLAGTGSIAFIVPDDIAEAYEEQSGTPSHDDETQAAPRKRGRPRKVAPKEEDTEN